jgi:hypothetical protein
MSIKNVFLSTIAAPAAAAIMAFALATPAASAQVSFGIHIGNPPPPLRYEARPPAPGPGFVWSEGFYEPYNGAYRWHAGYWNRPPYQGAYWVHPHWDHYNDGWHMHEGYWSHEDHDNHYWDNHHGGDDHHPQNDHHPQR